MNNKQNFEHICEENHLRYTRQRHHILSILTNTPDHPTAEEIYTRARIDMPNLSLATVYNCLETFCTSGVIRPVHFEREPTRYCANIATHAHFHCKQNNSIIDINLSPSTIEALKKDIPPHLQLESIEILLSGNQNNNL